MGGILDVVGGSADRLLALVGAIYESALLPEGFPALLSRVADALQAVQGVYLLQDLSVGRLIAGSLTRMDPADMAVYDRDWLAHDLGFKALSTLPAGTLLSDDDLRLAHPEINWHRTAIYNEYFRPRQMDHTIGVCPVRDTPVLGLLSFHRESQPGPFGAEERSILQRLAPHVARAGVIQRYLLDAVSQRQAAVQALDRLTTGVFFLDAAGRIILMNRAARELAAGADGLALGSDGLRAALAIETTRLRRLIRAASETSSGMGTGAGGVLRLSRPSGRPALCVVVSPVRLAHPMLWRECANVVVFVNDPERVVAAPLGILVRLYGLTPAEARVCRQLLRGQDVSEMAARFKITEDGIRKHLRQALRKTGTRRQAELVQVLLSSLVGMEEDEGVPPSGRTEARD